MPDCMHTGYDSALGAWLIIAVSAMASSNAATGTCFCCGAGAPHIVCAGCRTATYCSAACQTRARTAFDHDTHCAAFKLHAPTLGMHIYEMEKIKRAGVPPPNVVFEWFERELLIQWPDVGNVPVVNSVLAERDSPARTFIDAQYVAMMSLFFVDHGLSTGDVDEFLRDMRMLADDVAEYRLNALYNIVEDVPMYRGDSAFAKLFDLVANKNTLFPEAQIIALLTPVMPSPTDDDDDDDDDTNKLQRIVNALRVFHEFGPSFADVLIAGSESVSMGILPVHTRLFVNGSRTSQQHVFTSFIELVYYWNWELIQAAYVATVTAARAPKRSRDDGFPVTIERAKRQRIAYEVARAHQAQLDDPSTIPLEMRLHVALWLPARDIIRYILRVTPPGDQNDRLARAVVNLVIERDFLEPQRRHIANLDAPDRANVEQFVRAVDAYARDPTLVAKPFWSVLRPCLQYALVDDWLWNRNYAKPEDVALLQHDHAYVARKAAVFFTRVNQTYRAYTRSVTGHLMIYYSIAANKLSAIRATLQRREVATLEAFELTYVGTNVAFKLIFNSQRHVQAIETLGTNPAPVSAAHMTLLNQWIVNQSVPRDTATKMLISPLVPGRDVVHMLIAHVLVTVDPTLAGITHTKNVNRTAATRFLDLAVRQSVHPRARRLTGIDAPDELTRHVNVIMVAPISDDPYVMRAVYDPTQPPDPRPVTSATIINDDMTHVFAARMPVGPQY